MVQNHILVNESKQEYITFGGYSKQGEITGSTVQSKLALTFLFENQGCLIFFLASDWQTWSALHNIDLAILRLTQDKVYADYKDVTAEYIYHLLEAGDELEGVPEEFLHYFKRPEKCSKCGSDNIGMLDEGFHPTIGDEEYQKAGGRYYCVGCGAALTVP